ncbi:hypothetical protein [Embleya scabrispora]|uniref:hypothetical protein n=1 Tax=Embleya scabrispora TaxID=159449 RepID=UPI001375029E|nr:hypothetical protein [Embleya scabrispora]
MSGVGNGSDDHRPTVPAAVAALLAAAEPFANLTQAVAPPNRRPAPPLDGLR